MAEPSIVTKWDFLFSWLLIGVERAEGRFSAADTPRGAQAVAVFTDEELAGRQLPSDVFDIKVISARDLLMMMPAGFGAPSSSISSRWKSAVGALPMTTIDSLRRPRQSSTAAAERVV